MLLICSGTKIKEEQPNFEDKGNWQEEFELDSPLVDIPIIRILCY